MASALTRLGSLPLLGAMIVLTGCSKPAFEGPEAKAFKDFLADPPPIRKIVFKRYQGKKGENSQRLVGVWRDGDFMLRYVNR